MYPEELQELRRRILRILALVTMTLPGGPSVPDEPAIHEPEGAAEVAPQAEQLVEEAGQVAEQEEDVVAEEEEEEGEEEGQAEAEVPQEALEEEAEGQPEVPNEAMGEVGPGMPEAPQQALEELGPALQEVLQEAGQELLQAEAEMHQPALEGAEEDAPQVQEHAVEEEDQDVVEVVLQAIGRVVEEAGQVEPLPLQSVLLSNQVVLLSGQELTVIGHAQVSDSQAIENVSELMVGQGECINVSAVLYTDYGPLVQMLGFAKVRRGRVAVNADDVELDGNIQLVHAPTFVMQPNQTVLLSGTLRVQQGGVITVGGIEMVKVGGQMKVMPGQRLRVTDVAGAVTGKVKISPEQDVDVFGRMRAHASQTMVSERLLGRL